MTLIWPWMLIALMPVALAAAWVLWRPMRRTATVPALSLWQQAAASLAGEGRRRQRRVKAAWVCLLCGAAAAAVALARPKVHTTAPRRHLAVAVYPSAELAGDDGAALRRAADRLLERLSAADRVQLVLPDVLGGRTDWLSPAQVRRRIDALPILPARADELSVSLPPAGEAPTIILAPAGAGLTGGGNVSLVELPTALPAVTIDALGAVELPDGGMQVFVAARNHTDRPLAVMVQVQVPAGDGARAAGNSQLVTIPAGERAATTQTLAAAGETISLAVYSQAGGEPLDLAYLARRPVARRKIAMIGEDNPLVRRYISSDESLVLVGDAAEADVVIANGTTAAGGKPSLVFRAVAVKPFGDQSAVLQHAQLDQADITADHPVMAGVDLAGVAVRRLPTWQGAGSSLWAKVLAGVDGGAFIVVDEAGRRGQVIGKAVYVLPDISPSNTNWTTLESFVIFMTNAVRWLAPGENGGEYGYRVPIEAGRPADWRPAGIAGRGDSGDAAPLLPPGVYADADGSLHALSLVGLRAGSPDVPVKQAVDAAQLGEAVSEGFSLEVWPMLAGLAAALWLVGWALRVLG